MKKIIKQLLIITIISLMGISCTQAKEGSQKALALDFKLQDLNKNSVALSDYKGRNPVIIAFWTTWCPFCRVELSKLNDRYPQLVKEGWEVLAVNVGESQEIVGVFIKKRPLNLKVLLDIDTQVAHSYEVLGVPTFLLVNKDGFVVFRDNYFPADKYKELILK